MEAVIKLTADELKPDLLDKLKSLAQNEDVEIIIQLRKKASATWVDTDDYLHYFNQSIADKEAGRTTVFSMDEFRQYVTENFPQ